MPNQELPSRADTSVNGVPLSIFGFMSDDFFRCAPDAVGGNTLFLREIQALPPKAVFLDLGANIGATTAVCGVLRPDVRIIAVEPGPRALQCLRQTVAANSLSVTIHAVAVGATPGVVEFAQPDFLAGSHIVGPGQGYQADGRVVVEMRTVDQICAGLDRLDLIKIDVEGFELDVLKGARATIRKHRPLIIMEFNSWAITAWANQSPRALLDYLVAEFGGLHTLDGNHVATNEQALTLLHNNMTTGRCVDDLLIKTWETRAEGARH